MLLLLKLYWKELAGILIISATLYTCYDWAYDRGYNASEINIAKILKQRDEIQAAQTISIETLAKTISDSSDASIKQSELNLATILLSVKNKPLYRLTPEGKCAPSQDFENTYRDLLR